MTNISLSYAHRFALAAFLTIVLGCGPEDGVAEFNAGKAAFDAQDFGKAAKMFRASVGFDPENVDAQIYLARASLALGELENAAKSIANASELAADDVDVRLLGAQITWHLKDYEKAAKLYVDIANDAKFSPKIRSDAWTGLGIVEMTAGEPHLARVDFLRAIRIDRRNAAAWYHLGLLYRDAPFGYLDAALEQLEIFVRLDSAASPRVQKTMRAIIPGLKESIARTTADRPGAAKRNSQMCATAIAKAEAAIKKKSYKMARQCYQEALLADALSYPAALGLARMWQRSDSSRAGQEKALENYKIACQLRPGAVSTFLTAGELAAKLGMHAQALEIFSRAIAANPSSLQALDGLIRAMRRVGGRQKEAAAYQLYRESVAQVRKK